MTYEEKIKTSLSDSDSWPHYKPDVMAKLDEMSDDALSISNIDERACIASILILQQLTEELLKVLLRSCYLLVQVRLLPLEIDLKEPSGKMFGRVVEDLKATIHFLDKDKLVQLANKINKQRINIAHRLIERTSLDDLPNMAMQVRSDFEQFFELYNNGYYWIKSRLKDLKQEVLKG